jgi:NitT/TauT family transport system substrate-binding protein
VFAFVILSIVIGCSISISKPLRISTNLWIGYSPFFYIQQKGWLKEHNIEMVNVVSLSENMQMYESGFVNAFTGTQYEFAEMRKKASGLEPTILLDRSLGGDVIMGNRDIKTLQKAQKINVYLEIDSVNKVLLDSFRELYDINPSVLHFINKDPDDSSMLAMNDEPTLIITYKPYDILLKKSGYEVLDTTKNVSLFVMDALYTDLKIRKEYAEELAVLNQLIAKALDHLKKDPEEYFSAIRVFFKYKDQSTFLKALESIQWIYDDRSLKLMKQLEAHHIPTNNILEPVHEF